MEKTPTSCCYVVRALGLEPSLFRGKSPVPHQSGVTREVGREGIEPSRQSFGGSPVAMTLRPIGGAS